MKQDITSAPLISKQWTVAARPKTDLDHRHFAYTETEVNPPQSGEVLLRTHYLNVAPVMRMYMMESGGATNSPEAPLRLGDVIHGRGVAEVIASKHADFKTGDFVHGQIGWQTHKITTATPQERFIKMRARSLPAHFGLSALGMTGYSAYCGFVSRAQPLANDAVLISGAAGGVGSLVVQIAKALGCSPIIGIAGGQKKCQLVTDLGADAVIDYKADDVAERIKYHFPNGIDIYFDNVGGIILEAALDNLAYAARVVLCGSISEYASEDPFGPRNYTKLRSSNSDMKGFFVYNHQNEFKQAESSMADWIQQGKLRALIDITDGFEHMPDALIGLYTGKNKGKQIVRVTPGEDAMY